MIFQNSTQAQWAIANFESYLLNGKTDEYLQKSQEDLYKLDRHNQREALLTMNLFQMLTRNLNNQMDVDEFYEVVNGLDLEFSVTRYDVDHEFVVGRIRVEDYTYDILINESDESQLNIQFKGISNDNRSIITINCGANNYSAKMFKSTYSIPEMYSYDIEYYKYNNIILMSRPNRLR